ncbi:N-alpha-acetyltransferase 60 isoform X1 [Dasypus novemcinctus]|uniref:N-alpha-acetyltransferase 60 isoform X1 n=1 Tax=Dasypus novemcinctus TaxID=9361 RepID=UPI00062AB535|nr:N-alpha-acetyltransferase 60 isoform X1 [Dasypus novemcinctus]XP_012373405.1 N-alpha-acetyltransferase 60 isoform X1 [Dasypus novemcinctus]XP_023439202.1 N-alpha-acetyltransferase 60 isoform X1 [Dasypus novemcinctus]XP_058142547.1 N-alpha-acetyltransferase 60 isoform X1 [Dasypus novemcinctus]
MTEVVPSSALSEVSLRLLSHDDIDTVKQLCGDWFPIEYPDSWYRDITSNSKFFSLAATYRGAIVGMIVAEIKSRTKIHKEDGDILASSFSVDTQVAYILSLGVVKEFRKHGIELHGLHPAPGLGTSQPEPLLHPTEDLPPGPQPALQLLAVVEHLRQGRHRVQPDHVRPPLLPAPQPHPSAPHRATFGPLDLCCPSRRPRAHLVPHRLFQALLLWVPSPAFHGQSLALPASPAAGWGVAAFPALRVFYPGRKGARRGFTLAALAWPLPISAHPSQLLPRLE